MKVMLSKMAVAGVAAVLLAGFAVEASARGYHGHGPRARVGVYIGAPVVLGAWHYGYRPYYGYGYPYPYYYPPTTVVTSPPVYIEQSPQAAAAAPQAAAPASPAASYWYYCANPDGYYPYVKECPNGWQQVAPQPAR
ncbi:MAG TPA: hypothetical protein PKA20_24810 [Burkholderiaceae bacterium]|nr:hypothetical protein [Burkholderiaceae bacterium]